MNAREAQKREVDRQVGSMLARSAGFRALPPAEQARIRANTSAIVDTLAQGRLGRATAPAAVSGALARDPYAVPLDVTLPPAPTLPGMQPPAGGTPGATTQFTGGVQPGSSTTFGPKEQGDFGTAIATGVNQAGELLRQVNFPAFVAELVQGVFQAVVDASIQQMKAYGELVQSVVMSLNDFRDANVSENQGRDHLVSKFPKLMQINMSEAGPRVGLRPGADEDELADAAKSLGLGDDVSIDEETIEEQLVPAARNDLARSRQSLLATMLLMGINRIIVTDGKINAKLKFDFSARDSYQQHAQDYDYKDFGVSKAAQSTYESSSETGENYNSTYSYSPYASSSNQTGSSNRWSKGTYQTAETPVIYLTKLEDRVTGGELEATAKLSGEVSLNFKSETFDLNKLASADEVFKLERVRSAGRGAPGAPLTPEAGSGSGASAADNTAGTSTAAAPPAGA